MNWKGIELHVGDMVRLKNTRETHWNTIGLMDMYIGKIVTIKSFIITALEQYFIVEKDYGDTEGGWLFRPEDIAEVVSLDQDNASVTSTDLSCKGSKFIKHKYTSKIKIGNWEINLTDKTFTDEQIKNTKEMLGWDVVNLVEMKDVQN